MLFSKSRDFNAAIYKVIFKKSLLVKTTEKIKLHYLLLMLYKNEMDLRNQITLMKFNIVKINERTESNKNCVRLHD